MPRLPTPISELQSRLPEQGRIRIGVKVDGARKMKALDTFRLTSADRHAIDLAAGLYGGTPRPWSEGPRSDEWDLITERKLLPILLPPDPLGGTPIYELWRQSGIIRRCDGVTANLPIPSPEGSEWMECPCVCIAAELMECKPKLRLSVILRELPFAGAWRFETGSWNAVQEMPGMVAAIQSTQERGMFVGQLALESESVPRRRVIKGEEKIIQQHYKVVRLRLEASIEALAAGLNSVGALGSAGTAQALGTGEGGVSTFSPPVSEDGDRSGADASESGAESYRSMDDEIIDAELVDDDLSTDVRVEGGNRNLETALIIRVKELCDWFEQTHGEHLDDDAVRHDLAEGHSKVSRGGAVVRSSLQLTDREKHELMDRITRVMTPGSDLAFGMRDGKAKIGRRS